MNRQGPTLPPPEALLVACFEQSHDLLLLTDAAGHWRWANPAFCKAVGVRGELCGHLSMLCSTESSVDEVLQQALRQGHLADTEIELRTLGALPLWVRARANAVGDHRVWVFQPITEQRALAARAEHLTELLEIAQELGQVGIWERDIPSGSGRWSRHVLKLWGLDADEATPDLATTSQLIHEEDRASLHSVFVASTTKAGRYGYRFRIGRPDGHTRWIHAQWEVKNSPQGQPDRVLGVTMDSTEFHDLTRSLGDASAQLTLAVDLADISIWRHDLQTDRMHFNDRGFAVLGLPMRPEGMSVAEVRQLIHPDDMDEVIDSARRALRADRPTHMRARYRRSDGQWRHMLMRRVVQRGADGHALAFVGVALDVTEQVEREHQNLALTQRLELTAVAAGIGIWTLDLDTGVGTWNDQMYHLTGRPRHLPAPSRAEWIETIVYADDREMIERTRGPLVSGQTDRLELEYRIVRPDGALRWLVHRSRREVVNGRVMHVGVSLDITDHRRAELALRAADERAALAARSAGIGTWEVQLEDGLERWDTQMFLLRGLEPRPHPPLRQERIALLHPDDRGLSLDAHDGAVGSPRPWRYEFRVVLPDGSIRWLASRSIAIQNEHGKVIRRIGVNWDITDVKEAESARQQIEVAERASQAKSQFLSRMSHELRTPLNAVLGFTQLLLMEEDAATESGRVVKLRHILSAGEHLLTLIDGVLDLSSIEAGRMSLQLQPVDLAGVIEQALPLVTPLARKYGITLRQGSLHGTVQADRTRLLQIVVNLLSNAIKYNRPDGLVQIEAGRDGDTNRLWVNDTGRGMTPDQLAHLFEPFNRLGIEREGIDGTGIGMTIVKSLVQAMGGTITVQSQPGRGTQIEIGLVSAAAEPAAAAIAAPSARERERQLEQKPEPTPDIAAQRGGRLLYIEDNFINVTLVEELVQSVPGLQIVSELTGTLGVARAGSMQPDLVMVDMQLPDFDGFEVLRRLRAQPETAGLPCVALSANAMPEDIEQALRAGFVEYWTKPIDLRQFLAAMDRWFPPS